MLEQRSRSRIPSLDGLRAVSIILVVFSHYVTTAWYLPPGLRYHWSESLGPLGVRVFFVISGFLITTLLLGELKTTGRINLARFYFRRTLRIFVPYYAFLFGIIVLSAIGMVKLAPYDLIHAFTYTVDYYPDRSWSVGHAWSLSVEEQFYLLWPATLLLAGRRRGLWIAASLLLLVPIIRVAYSYLLPWVVKWEMGYRFETVADALATGCVLAGSYDWLGRQPLFQRVLRSKLILVVPMIVLYVSLQDPRLRRYLLLGITVQNIGIALCIAWCLSSYCGIFGKILNSKPLVQIGLMSYSIYLWHPPFMNPFSHTLITQFPLNVGLATLGAVGSYYLIERPSFALRRRLEGRFFPASRMQPIPSTEPGNSQLADVNVVTT